MHRPPSSSGLGLHPLKVAARVRIPLGVLKRIPCNRRGFWGFWVADGGLGVQEVGSPLAITVRFADLGSLCPSLASPDNVKAACTCPRRLPTTADQEE